MIKKKKPPIKAFIALLAVLMVGGYYLGGLFSYPSLTVDNYSNVLADILLHPFRNYWNDMTILVLGCALIGWIFFLAWYLQHNRDTHSEIEHGSSEWGDVQKVNDTLCDHEHPQNNRILSQHLKVGLDKLSNNNAIFVGSPGTGKTMFVVTPNLLLGGASYVILDVKGELLSKYGNYLRSIGHQIRVLNLKEMDKSDRYNPFSYIQEEDDIPRIIVNIFKSVEPPEATKGDPFWDDGCALYLQSLFYFTWMISLEDKLRIFRNASIQWDPVYETPTMNQITALTLLESQPSARTFRGNQAEEGYTKMTKLIDALEDIKGPEHPAVRDYRKLKEGAPETVSSIILILNAKLKFFNGPSVRRIFEADDMHLREIGMGREDDGQTKTALFLVVKENDTSYNFIVNMLYQQLFDTLIRSADFECKGALPIRVEVWMDEFANGVRPERFENLITTLRSRNIAAMLFLQSISQIKTLYKNDAWDILMDACSTFIFLGAGRGSLTTQKYISELTGNATIEKMSDGLSYSTNGGGSINYDRMQRALLSPEEVGRLPKNKCLIFLEGRQPMIDTKYQPFHDENYNKALKLGSYVHPVTVQKRKDGSLETVGNSPGFIFANDAMKESFCKKAQRPESRNVLFELTEEEFCAIQFPDLNEDISTENIFAELENMKREQVEKKIFQKLQEASDGNSFDKSSLKERDITMNKEQKEWNLKGNISTLIERYADRLTDEQLEQIVLGVKNGLTDEEVKIYFTLPAETMKRIRISLEQIHAGMEM